MLFVTEKHSIVELLILFVQVKFNINMIEVNMDIMKRVLSSIQPYRLPCKVMKINCVLTLV